MGAEYAYEKSHSPVNDFLQGMWQVLLLMKV